MTLRPSVINPATMVNARVRKNNTSVKKMVIDCKNESQWRAIHEQPVNGVVLRRRPIRAIETFLDNAPDELFQAQEFICSQAGLRKELESRLLLASDEEELRRKFLINDILKWSRVMIAQTRSRDYMVRICSELAPTFTTSTSSLCMLVTYRGQEITFRQPKDSDIRSFSPYGVGLFRGNSYSRSEECSVEWFGTKSGERAFYLMMEPHSKRGRR